MEYVILYFSGTGNTELIAGELAGLLNVGDNTVQLISIEDKAQLDDLNLDGKTVGFGFPVYKFSYPDIFNAVLPIINRLAMDNKYFLFSTYARFNAQAFYDFSCELDADKFKLIAQRCFKAPSCGISARMSSDAYEYKSVMFFEDNITQKLDEFADEILLGENIEVNQQKTFLGNLKKRIVQDVEITKYPKLSIDRLGCIMCGQCAKNCPDNNLNITDSKIDIVDDKDCLHCLRCINHCPVNAITFGELTDGDNQYTLKTRDELYNKASSGHLEKYWNDFDSIIKKWQRKTIKYWLLHRKWL